MRHLIIMLENKSRSINFQRKYVRIHVGRNVISYIKSIKLSQDNTDKKDLIDFQKGVKKTTSVFPSKNVQCVSMEKMWT